MPVDLLPQELGHRRVEPEALGEPDHRRVQRPQRVEQASRRPRYCRKVRRGSRVPVVLDDRRHLPVVADDDQLAVRLQRQRRHDRLGQVHLDGLVQHQQVAELVAEDVLRPLLLEHPVDAAGRDRHDRPARAPAITSALFGSPFSFSASLTRWMTPSGGGSLRGHPEERHVEQAGVEVLRRTGSGSASRSSRSFSRTSSTFFSSTSVAACVLQETKTRQVPLRLHRPLEPGEDGEGGASSSCPSRRPLDQQDRRPCRGRR